MKQELNIGTDTGNVCMRWKLLEHVETESQVIWALLLLFGWCRDSYSTIFMQLFCWLFGLLGCSETSRDSLNSEVYQVGVVCGLSTVVRMQGF